MPISLGANRYGKAEIRLVHVERSTPTHVVTDLNVSVALSGDLDAAHTEGDNANVLPTDTQKNTVYAFAAEHGIGSVEEFALRLGRHFVETPSIDRAVITIEAYPWRRLGPHSFQRDGGGVRGDTSGGGMGGRGATLVLMAFSRGEGGGAAWPGRARAPRHPRRNRPRSRGARSHARDGRRRSGALRGTHRRRCPR